MKKWMVTQRFDASAQAVADAFNQRTTWQAFSNLPFVGDPELQSFLPGDGARETRVAMAYQVAIDLPPLADAFIDADKMTFVENTQLAANGSGSFEIVPDHYTKLLKASGRIEMVPFDEGRCERLIQGSVDVSLGWSGKIFERPVEDAIVKGLIEALAAQASQLGF